MITEYEFLLEAMVDITVSLPSAEDEYICRVGDRNGPYELKLVEFKDKFLTAGVTHWVDPVKLKHILVRGD